MVAPMLDYWPAGQQEEVDRQLAATLSAVLLNRFQAYAALPDSLRKRSSASMSPSHRPCVQAMVR
jgi:hypothetical protein